MKYKSNLFEKNVNEKSICNQIIWYNQEIKYRNKELFFKKCKNSGIEKIRDIINIREKRILSYEEITNRIGYSAQLRFEYYAIVNALNRRWRNLISNVDEGSDNPETHILNIYKSKAKLIQMTIQEKMTDNIRPCSHNFWANNLGLTLTNKT